MSQDHVIRGPVPHYEELAALPGSELVARYALGVERIDKRIFDLTDDQLDTAFLESAGVGKWPIRVLLGHLAECEVLNTLRLRKTAAEEGPIFEGFDPEPYIDQGLYKLQPAGGSGDSARAACGAFIATIHTLRAWMHGWLLTVDDAVWVRNALHTKRGEFTFRGLLSLTVWHVEYHAAFIPKKVDLLMGRPGAASV